MLNQNREETRSRSLAIRRTNQLELHHLLVPILIWTSTISSRRELEQATLLLDRRKVTRISKTRMLTISNTLHRKDNKSIVIRNLSQPWDIIARMLHPATPRQPIGSPRFQTSLLLMASHILHRASSKEWEMPVWAPRTSTTTISNTKGWGRPTWPPITYLQIQIRRKGLALWNLLVKSNPRGPWS